MNSMTPSVVPMTDGQIDKAVSSYRDMLTKRRSEIGCSEAVQYALGQSGYIAEQVAVLRKYVEAVSSMIVRHVTVNRNRSLKEAIRATGRKEYLDGSVVASMPQGSGDKAEVFFIPLRRGMSDPEVAELLDMHGMRPADPHELIAANEADPAFADDHPNFTHNKDENGNWQYIAFPRWYGERSVYVYRSDDEWHGGWSVAGCRK